MPKKLTTKEFIDKAKEIHGDYYSYNNTIYKTYRDKVIITCPIHGDFEQFANSHLMGYSCKMCSIVSSSNKLKLTKGEFVKRSNTIHNDKYDYSKVEYVNNHTHVIITCPTHGVFKQTPMKHLIGRGCQKCGGTKKYTKDTFIEKALLVHNGRYDYTSTVFLSSNKPVNIVCPIHGEFEQLPYTHLTGCGCPNCNTSKLELEVKKILDNLKLEYTQQKSFEDLIYKKSLKFDFFIPLYNIAIECQGEQHFKHNKFFHKTKEEYLKLLECDRLKEVYCHKHNIQLIFYSNKNFTNTTNLITSKKKLINTINEIICQEEKH